MSETIFKLEDFLRNNGNFVVIGIATIFTVIFLFYLNSRRNNHVNDLISFDEITGEKEREIKRKKDETASNGLFPVEEAFFGMIGMQPNRTLIMGFRVIALILAVLAAAKFKFAAIYLVFEVFMFLWDKSNTKKVEDDNGLSYIDATNRFLDMYIPSVNNGQAVGQIMNRWVEQEKDDELTRWWYLDDDEKQQNIPRAWDQVIQIYNSGLYNEQNGFQDSAESFQHDLLQQVTYYNNFKEKVGEIVPIKGCYYIAIPLILYLSYINDPVFWSGIGGLIDSLALCLMLWLFVFLLSQLHKSTCEKLF